MAVKIEQASEYESLWPLFLLADPSRDAILEYIADSEIFVSKDGKSIAGVCVLSKIDSREYEIKNIAVLPEYQGRGIGNQMLEYVKNYVQERGSFALKICTGNSSIHQLRLYKRLGFKVQSSIEDYFIEKYPNPIYENGVLCKDLIILSQELQKA